MAFMAVASPFRTFDPYVFVFSIRSIVDAIPDILCVKPFPSLRNTL